MMGVIDEIAAERARQMSAEGWTPDHDDAHTKGELAFAAAAYAWRSAGGIETSGDPISPNILWPAGWVWKWSGPRRMLIKAAALIVAEIERFDRARMNEPKAGES